MTLPAHEVGLILRKANAVLDLDISGKSQLALVKDVQKDPVHQIIEHLDLIIVRKGEKVTIDVPVHVEGESFPGTIVALDATTLSVEAEATHIPERLVVDIEGAEEGTHVLARDVVLPDGVDPALRPGDARHQHHPAGQGRPGRGGRRRGRRRERRGCRGRGRGSGRGRGGVSPRRMATDTWLVVGLGNPGPDYAAHRHNVGQMALGVLADRIGASFTRHNGERGGRRGRHRARAARNSCSRKPEHFMNVSGGPVAALLKFYSLAAVALIVAARRARLALRHRPAEVGRRQRRPQRDPFDIAASIGSPDFIRVRIGIGRPPGRQDPADFVLSPFSKAEREVLPNLLSDAADAVEMVVADGLLAAQQHFHSPREGEQ